MNVSRNAIPSIRIPDEARDTPVPIAAHHFATLVQLAGPGVSVKSLVDVALTLFLERRAITPAAPAMKQGPRRCDRPRQRSQSRKKASLFVAQKGICAKCGGKIAQTLVYILRDANGKPEAICGECKIGGVSVAASPDAVVDGKAVTA